MFSFWKSGKNILYLIITEKFSKHMIFAYYVILYDFHYFF